MADIVKDIIDEVIDNTEIKPSKSKTIIRWTIRISIVLIGLAFIYGQYKASQSNNIDGIKKSLDNNTNALIELKKETTIGFEIVNERVDKVYTDGYKAFNDYQLYNKKQLELIIDYGQMNKELVKKMLEVNMTEKDKNVETELEISKREAIISMPKTPVIKYISRTTVINTETKDTTYHIVGGTNGYLNSIDKNKYTITNLHNNEKNVNLFDFSYKTIK